MWTFLVVGLVISVIVLLQRVLVLEHSLRRLRDHAVPSTTEKSLGDAGEELEHRVEVLERDIGTWIERSPLSDSFDALQRRVDAIQEDVGSRLEAVERGAAVLVREVPRESEGDEPALRSKEVFAQLVRRVAPMPLQRACEFTIGLSDKFWIHRLNAGQSELAYIKDHGEQLVSLTLEFWRTHTVVRITLAPWTGQTDSGRWPTQQELPAPERVKRLYASRADESSSYSVLWEAPLDPLARLQLRLAANTLVFCAIYGRFGHTSDPCLHPWEHRPIEQNILLVVPLDEMMLESFKRPDDDKSDMEPQFWEYFAEPWLTCYETPDESSDGHDGNGIYWRLWIHDLEKEAAETAGRWQHA